MQPPTQYPDVYYLGVDLGKLHDRSAVVGLLRKRVWQDGRYIRRYQACGVKSWLIGTTYTSIASDIAGMTAGPPLAGCVLGVDRNAVGEGVIEMIRVARVNARLVPIFSTGGHSVSAGRSGDGLNVPKADQVGALHAVLQESRLEVYEDLGADAFALKKELETFQERITAAGNTAYDADPRQKAHDDLVRALATAIWLGEQMPEPFTGPLLMDPPHPDLVRCERDLVAAQRASTRHMERPGTVQGEMDRHEALRLAEAVLTNKMSFEAEHKQPARAVLLQCGRTEGEVREAETKDPVPPMLQDLGNGAVKLFGDVTVFFDD